MPFPNFTDKYNGHPIMRPEDTLAMRRRFGNFPQGEPPHGLIFCLKNDLPHKLRWQIPVQKAGRILGDFYRIKSTRGRVGVLSNFGIGAPVVASLAEEMIAWGVKQFIVLSWGGAIQPSLNTGDLMLVDKAIRDEGVSHHYLPAEKFTHADAALTQRIASRLPQIQSGATWTTDAPYRETREEILAYQADGVQVVEMEIAALFTLGKVHDVPAAAAVVVADRLANLKWESPADMISINRSFETAYFAAIAVLNEDA